MTKSLAPEQLFTVCDLDSLPFETTADLEELTQIVGQDRALEALQFGIGMHHAGYNLYVLGPAGMGKHTVVRQFLDRQAQEDHRPSDWCYVNNFADAHKPRALRLPPGIGAKFRQDMEHLLDELKSAIPSIFESDDYRSQLQEIEDELNSLQEAEFKALQQEAEKSQINLLRTPRGFAFAPMRNGEVINPEEFNKLPQDDQDRIEQKVGELQEKLQKILTQIPQWRKQSRSKIKALNSKVTMFAVGMLLDEVRRTYADLPEVMAYLQALQQDIIENVDDFRPQEKSPMQVFGLPDSSQPSFRRYQVNLLVDHGSAAGSPVVYEDNPTYQNLVGQVEHLAQMGALVTDFSLIKSGALHRANGGYLVLDVRKLLINPYAWEGLKRALYARKVTIESLGQMLSLVSTVSLEPEPIPLDVKVVLLGDRMLYYLLYHYDPDFRELFKVAADFEDEVDRQDANNQLYARLIATMVKREQLLPFDRSAVGRVIEHSARIAGDAEKLSTHLHSMADLLREADHWARIGGREAATNADVQQAINAQIRRADRVRTKVYEGIKRGTILIDVTGEKPAQVNGLSVIQLGNFMFGQPSRITATARIGEGKVIDIEREVELGGAIHSKGVLILSSFLAHRYALEKPLSLSASLVFEQSYGQVDGDSASVAELCALISALTGVPIKQSLAVTGSVNQHGMVQAIGGVNEKIEGFFDVCKAHGLTGSQGVLVPAANVKHLMLRQDVVDAVRQGLFHIYPLTTIDEAIELLTGMTAGVRDDEGGFPPASINGKMIARLDEFSRLRQEFAETGKEKNREHEE
ncbi:MAG: AAA family ATPase [Deltaproteobacteria bacterium]|nr:AAA family ATPase [Candidatus Anaeroferrophillus wilburensis]MBN2889705.1 AAA family ATPase [Deltaproteobacteria bacterium]